MGWGNHTNDLRRCPGANEDDELADKNEGVLMDASEAAEVAVDADEGEFIDFRCDLVCSRSASSFWCMARASLESSAVIVPMLSIMSALMPWDSLGTTVAVTGLVSPSVAILWHLHEPSACAAERFFWNHIKTGIKKMITSTRTTANKIISKGVNDG